MRTLNALAALWTTLCLVPGMRAIEIDITNEQSVKDAASTAMWGAMSYYQGNISGNIPGNIPSKWYEGAVLFLSTINYWYFTNDTTYNDVTKVGLDFQGEPGDYMPPNWTQWIGNDDQFFWGCAAMTAAELNFPEYGQWSWLSLAQGVFNDQTAKPNPSNTGWDPTSCGGGVHWQKFEEQGGFYVKNSIANGGLFQLSARLYRYTNNPFYANWAQKIWDWSVGHLIVNGTFEVWDTVSIDKDDCHFPGRTPWTYNYASYLLGAAYMYAQTTGADQERWLNIVYGLTNKTLDTFFLKKNGYVLEEISCDPWPTQCFDSNSILFKGPSVLWLGWTAILVPQVYDTIMPKLQVTAQGAAASCTGPTTPELCGCSWYQKKLDPRLGLEPMMSASNIFTINLLSFDTQRQKQGPLTSSTGGTSKGNFNAGKNSGSQNSTPPAPITTADRAGAGVLTAVFLSIWLGVVVWMFLEE
ncbi:hypothetical protein N7510_007413 [Penicillium lagena]|uniref:uncharacterized protein n=1 Tax=Penicillium lagena TaxID=94218 RepID=UPI00253F6B81|nr:uncharacterized protein N7510_007413 [Penicillium lagena]KAJ5610694.1 hypothetical protein N7510_007413 [Penicillium lagena]